MLGGRVSTASPRPISQETAANITEAVKMITEPY